MQSSEVLRIGFAGTPDFAVPALRSLFGTNHEIVAVYTQPDRPAGRGRKTRPSAVKQVALELGVSVLQPDTLRSDEALQQMQSLKLDVLVVVAYGLILPRSILDCPALGCLNIHGSLLPRWRGAAPIHRAVLAGDSHTGVTIMLMEEGLDTGPMVSQKSIPIQSTSTSAGLHDQLAELGAQALIDVLPDWAAGKMTPENQDDALATYADKLQKDESAIDWRQSAEQIDRRIRAFNPWPVAQTRLNGEVLRIWLSTVHQCSSPGAAIPDDTQAQPGTVVGCTREGVDVICGEGIVRLLELQLPGKKALTCADFANGRDISGQVLGPGSDERIPDPVNRPADYVRPDRNEKNTRKPSSAPDQSGIQ